MTNQKTAPKIESLEQTTERNKMIKYNIVVINSEGFIIGVEEYNPAQRPTSVTAAVAAIAVRLNIPAPEFRNFAIDEIGNEWGKMPGDLQIGMVEIGFGKWGFPR